MSTPEARKLSGTSIALNQLDAHPDAVDFRDLMFIPSHNRPPQELTLADYFSRCVPHTPLILDQGRHGASTGFGLATVANYHLRRRPQLPDPTPVSPRMLYEMARQYDDWPGHKYPGSSARGAMKGWHKHGVCAESLWPAEAEAEAEVSRVALTHERAADAALRPLNHYSRVNHKDLTTLRHAVAEVGIAFATSAVHEGWGNIQSDGTIPLSLKPLGAHAFALVGYDDTGFWIQNSWGTSWGIDGFARLTYDDWLLHGADVWVAHLGVPMAGRRNSAPNKRTPQTSV